MVAQKIHGVVAAAVAEAVDGSAGIDFTVERPKQAGHGDYATNAALVAATREGKDPREVAEALREQLAGSELFESVEVAGPGFLNFTVAQGELLHVLTTVQSEGPRFGRSTGGQGKHAVIEYSHPNIAKRFSIGHLRSTIVGQALCNLYDATGWKVTATNHLGDWGTQFGKMLVAIDCWGTTTELSIEELERLYIKFHEEAEKDPALDDEARAAFQKLEAGNAALRKRWQQLVTQSMREFDTIYDRLGVHIKHPYGESKYEPMLKEIIDEAVQAGIAQQSEGALIITFPDDALPPAILRKSDGASTYLTRDLGAIKFRRAEWQPDRLVYEVGAEQSLHFQQLFWTAELLGWGTRADYVHVPHGLIRLAEGKMSTRRGRTIKLEAVLQEAIERAKKFNGDAVVADAVGIGAVKYNDLKRSPGTGYTFDWDEMLTLEGNSGPYIQYVYARCQAVLRKAGAGDVALTKNQKKSSSELALEVHERELLLLLDQFSTQIAEAVHRHTPNLVCSYLFTLTQTFNRFYEASPILKADTEEQRNFRIALTHAVAMVIANGLDLLGISAPEQM